MHQALASRHRTALPDASRLTSLISDPASTAYDLTLGFAYNDAGQIKSRTASNDAYSWNRATNVTDAFTANGLNQMKMGSTFGYDARGNLTASGSDSYSYSSENLLTSGTVDGVTTPLTYDPLLRLYQIGTTGGMKLVYDGGNIIGQSNGTTLGRRYVAAPGSDEVLVEYKVSNGTKDYKLTDERGSVIATTDASGNGATVNSYDEYGIPGSGNVGRFQYTGQFYLAELGLQYSKARMYSPTLGRFMQTDPIGYGDGMNWYNYVKGDPVNWSDPSGLATPLPHRCDDGMMLVDCTGHQDIVICGDCGGGGAGARLDAIGSNLVDPANGGEALGDRDIVITASVSRPCRQLQKNTDSAKGVLPSYITGNDNWNNTSMLKGFKNLYQSSNNDYTIMSSGAIKIAGVVAGAVCKFVGPCKISALVGVVGAAGKTADIGGYMPSDLKEATAASVRAIDARLQELKSKCF